MWKTIKRLLLPNNKVIKADPDELNQHYVTLAERISPTEADPFKPSQLDGIDNENDFQFAPTTINDIEKAIKELRDDCSTGFDQIPVKYIKPVSDFLSSPLTHIINNCISIMLFLINGRLTESVQFQRLRTQGILWIIFQFQSFQFCQKYLKKL